MLAWTRRRAGRGDRRAASTHASSTQVDGRVQQLTLVAQDAYKRLLAFSIEVELRLELKTRADEEAIAIFGRNLEQLLLAAPAGERIVIGLDPGFRTGVKVAARVAHRRRARTPTRGCCTSPTASPPRSLRLVTTHRRRAHRHRQRHRVARDGGARARRRCASAALATPPQVVVVSEAGASVYSASELAREELPELDVSLRGAVSIARRLQDPLAELVKIDPKSIGVGQYQHDVNQPRLKKRLDDVVDELRSTTSASR